MHADTSATLMSATVVNYHQTSPPTRTMHGVLVFKVGSFLMSIGEYRRYSGARLLRVQSENAEFPQLDAALESVSKFRSLTLPRQKKQRTHSGDKLGQGKGSGSGVENDEGSI